MDADDSCTAIWNVNVVNTTELYTSVVKMINLMCILLREVVQNLDG